MVGTTRPVNAAVVRLLFSVTDHFAFDRARIDACEAFFHRRCEQRYVRDFAEMFGDEPDWFFCCHPGETIEPGEIYRT